MKKRTIRLSLEALYHYKKKFCVDGKLFDMGVCDTQMSKNHSKKMSEIREAIKDLEEYDGTYTSG